MGRACKKKFEGWRMNYPTIDAVVRKLWTSDCRHGPQFLAESS